MRIDRSGVPFILGAALPAVFFGMARRPQWSIPFAALAAFFTYFFRDPERTPPAGAGVVLAPADGRVMVAGAPQPGVAPAGDWLQVSIFLSPRDVHVNRAPVTGTVTRVAYTPGRFLPAYRPEAAVLNERNEIWLEQNGHTIVCRQVVGILARRIVCRVTSGTRVQAGERFGIMKFGSRMDVFLPTAATLRVSIGDRVRAGETIVATLP